MYNETTHPVEKEVKLIEGLNGKEKRRDVWVWIFNTEGSENMISLKLARTIN